MIMLDKFSDGRSEMPHCKARRDSRSALPGCAEFSDRKPPAIAANAPIFEQSGLGGVFALDDGRGGKRLSGT
jgi:hypothetical protein